MNVSGRSKAAPHEITKFHSPFQTSLHARLVAIIEDEFAVCTVKLDPWMLQNLKNYMLVSLLLSSSLLFLLVQLRLYFAVAIKKSTRSISGCRLSNYFRNDALVKVQVADAGGHHDYDIRVA